MSRMTIGKSGALTHWISIKIFAHVGNTNLNFNSLVRNCQRLQWLLVIVSWLTEQKLPEAIMNLLFKLIVMLQ